jgi:hypothetical protein
MLFKFSALPDKPQALEIDVIEKGSRVYICHTSGQQSTKSTKNPGIFSALIPGKDAMLNLFSSAGFGHMKY